MGSSSGTLHCFAESACTDSITNGFLAGLVAITSPCYWVSPFGSVLIGGFARILVIFGVDLLEYLRIDDPIGAVPVHMMNGIWGTLSLGLFASGQFSAIGFRPIPNM